MSTGVVHKVRTCSTGVSTGAVHKVRTCSSVHWSCTQGEDVFKCPLELYTG